MPLDRRRFLCDTTTTGIGLWLSGSSDSQDLPVDGKPIVCRVIDAESGNKVPARVRLRDAHGNDVVPLGHPQRLADNAHEGDVRFQLHRYAYVDGEFAVDPVWLPLKYQVLKGHEFGITEGELAAGKAQDGTFKIPLSRWSSLSRRGWYSGDIHIHYIAPKTCRLEMEAEDLNVANILTCDVTTDQNQFEGRINSFSSGQRLIYVNQEFRNNQLGHLCLLNLQHLIEPVKEIQPYHYPLHMDVCDRVHAQGGYVSWAHFPSWPGVENPLDVALEKLDGLEILCVLDPREMPIFMKQVVPEMEANHGLRLWYRYLNCGFRLTATAGTDKMTTFVTVGANRCYAHVDGELSYQNWIAALKRGRTFVTNNPILTFTVNDEEPGSVLNLHSTKDHSLRIHAAAESQLPYHHLEIVSNGEVIAEATPSGSRHKAEIHLQHPVSRSCWIAARAYEDKQTYVGHNIDFAKVHSDEGTLLSGYYGTRRPETVFAHSSPVYVIDDGKPIRSWSDAEYYVRYIDNAIHWLNTEAKFARPSDKKSSIEAFERGRSVFVARARQ